MVGACPMHPLGFIESRTVSFPCVVSAFLSDFSVEGGRYFDESFVQLWVFLG